MFKKVTIQFTLPTLLILLVTLFAPPVFGYIEIPKFLCEAGTKYYEKGDYLNALHEFNKVLMISSGGKQAGIAREYIGIIRKKIARAKEEVISEREVAIQRALAEVLVEPKIEAPEKVPEKKIIKIIPAKGIIVEEEALEERIPAEVLKEKLVLDEELRAREPYAKVELELNKAFVIEGREIARWLVTAPEIIDIERVDIDHIKVTSKKFGRSFLHIWKQSGRWTLNIEVIAPRYIHRLIEKYREKLEEAEPFKFRYSFSRDSFHKGKRLSSTARQTVASNQWLGLTGETPYGYFDTRAQISKLRETTDLKYFTIGLTDASIAGFEDFDIRGFDYTAGFSELCFPGESLRGIRFEKASGDNGLSYTTIWGREDQGKFGKLSPGLAELKDAFIYGGQLDYSPSESLRYRLSSAWGYGDDREEYLKDNVVDFEIDYRVKKGLTLGGEIAYDSDSIALILNSQIVAPKLRLSGEFRDLEKDFLTITGRPSRSGEIGGRIGASYAPFSRLNLSGDLNLYRDRLFPNPNKPHRLNFDFNSSSNLTINPTTSIRLNYQHIDESGKLSPRKAKGFGLGINKRFPELRKLSTYLNYRYRDSENPESPTLDYTTNSLTGGLSLKISDNLIYYLSKEVNWLTEQYSDEKSCPSVFQTGLDYTHQLFRLPLYTTLRLNYRDEEDATAPHSFLAGEDSIEFSGKISYRPTADFELFASARLKDIRADSPDAEERAEIEVRAGGRLLWDTGFSWNPVCSVTGLVYKDLNDDGKKQDNESGIENVKLFIEKKEIITDKNGSYILTGIKGKKATVGIDVSSLPQGFVVSGPGLREIEIEQGKMYRVDFGIISRSEIYGMVFEDIDGNGKFGIGDIGIGKVNLSLEDGRGAVTDSKGQYYFRRVATGEHIITLDIDSLPLEYLPSIALTKKITLFEGITYIHHIPLKRAK